MTIPALPAEGSTAWYAHYAALDVEARKVAGKLDTAVATSTYALQVRDRLAAREARLLAEQDYYLNNTAPDSGVDGPTAANAATSIVGGVNVEAVLTGAVNPIFRYSRCAPVVAGATFPDNTLVKGAGLTATSTELNPLVKFNYQGPRVLEFRILGRGPKITTYRVRVDGLWASSQNVLPGPPNDGNFYRYRIIMPDTEKHEVAIEFGGFLTRFAGLTVDPSAKVTLDSKPRGLRLIIAGDSQTEGANGEVDVLGNLRGFAPDVGRLLGLDDTWQSGVGETGYLATSNGTRPKLRDRIASDITSRAPDWVHLAMGQNDVAFTYAQLYPEVLACIDQIRAGLPSACITLQSNFNPTTGNGLTVSRAAIRDAAVARGLLFVDMTAFLGTNPAFLSADNSHLSPAGHKVASVKIAAALRELLSPAGAVTP